MADQPSKSDIEAVFHRLRGIPTNKTCFDCQAKNPTWSSITYGVFICLDCSAAHRSLGVHLSFVRSTQLDTNWTWMQLHQMQLGGNGNAITFFTQHNCVTTDAQKKYNSRAAQLYRDKLQQLALKALHNNKQVYVQPEQKTQEEEADFFTEHESFTSDLPTILQAPTETIKEKVKSLVEDGEGPKVDFTVNSENLHERKPLIGARKPQQKKSGLGAKKGGLGATKVKTNFAELEKEAALAEESQLRAQEESARVAALSVEEKAEREAAVRLAYKDLSVQQQQKEDQLRRADPKKAEQMERLGMGFNARSGISHSAVSDMKTIEQERLEFNSSSLTNLGKLRIGDSDSLFDDYGISSGFSMNRNTSSFGSNKGLDSLLSETSGSRDQWVIVDDPVVEKPRNSSRPVDRTPSKNVDTSTDLAQKKFGSAKAISSEQFFNDYANDYEHQANLNRFQGSSSISSSDFFGNGKDTAQSSTKFQPPDLDDVRESVRQGVTKVAGKLSSLANGVMSSLQDRYGY